MSDGSQAADRKQGSHPMISGAHMVLYSNDAEADRHFLRDVLGMSMPGMAG